MAETAKPYIDHLRPPGVRFISISDYNTKFNSKIKENTELEKLCSTALLDGIS